MKNCLPIRTSALLATLLLILSTSHTAVFGTPMPPGSTYNLTQINGSFAKGYTDWNDVSCAGYINNVTEVGYTQTLLSDGYTFSPAGCFGGPVNGIYNWPSAYHNLTFTSIGGPITFSSVSFMTSRNYDSNTQLGVDYWNGSVWVNAVTTTSGALGITTGTIQTKTISFTAVTASQFRFFWNAGQQVNMHEFWIDGACAPITNSVTLSACNSYVWPSTGLTYTTSGIYTDTLTGALGCDSINILNLTINTATSFTATIGVCDSFTWATTGLTYTTSGIYSDTLVNAAGCDSIDILNLSVYASSDTTLTVDACESYTWSTTGLTYTTSGSYSDTLMSVTGCDSILTLNLTILDASASSLTATACDSYTLNSVTYDSSGTYIQTLVNAAGCDSVLTLNLSITTIDDSVSLASGTLNAMPGYSYQWLNCDSAFAAIAGATSQSFTPTVSGNYAVQITSGACVDTSACENVTVVGIDQGAFTSLSIFPNPAHDNVTIAGLSGTNTWMLVNSLGQVVLQGTTLGAEHTLNLASLAAGVYTLRVQGDAGIGTRKLVVE